MKISPIILALPIFTLFAMSKKSKSTSKASKPIVKEEKPVEEKPVEEKPVESDKFGFTMDNCSNFKITNQDIFTKYNEELLASLVKLDVNSPAKTNPFNFALMYLSYFPSNGNGACVDLFEGDAISTTEQFILIYSLLSKGMQYFINKVLLENDAWKKHGFINLLQVENYINKSQYKFEEWYDSVKADGFSAEEYEKYEKIFGLKDIPETLVDSGIEYNCASIKLVNAEKAREYLSQVAEYITVVNSKFTNPMDVNFFDFAMSAFEFMSPQCFKLYKDGGMKDDEFVIMLKMMEILSNAYITNNFENPNDIAKYKVSVFLPQWISIRQNTFPFVSEADLEEFDLAIEEKGMYP